MVLIKFEGKPFYPLDLQQDSQTISVNIGGWLVTEPVSRFISSPILILLTLSPLVYVRCFVFARVQLIGASSSPALYQKYSSNPTPPVDEWTLFQAMSADSAGGGIQQLETHYKTFIVRIFRLIAILHVH